MKLALKLALFVLCCVLAAPAQTLDRAMALWRAQDFDGANNAFKSLVAANPGNAEYHYQWGRLFYERFNAEEAANLYNETLMINPKHAGAMFGLAQIAADEYNPKAEEYAQKAIDADPKLYQADELIARIALEDDNRKKAQEMADAALAINPDAVDAIAIRASLDLLQDKESPWVAKLGNRGKGYETIAHFYDINRRYEEGIVYLHKAIAATPDLWSAHSQLGISLMQLAREDEAKKELEIAYDNHFRDAVTVNSLRLMDSYKNFDTFRTPTTILRISKKETALRPYFENELKLIMATYEKKYQYKLTVPVQVEVYPNHDDFAVRTLGMPGMNGALGVTFNAVVAMDSPSGRKPGEFHWASTLWHEMSHVYILNLTKERVPRWFTEGLAVHEETAIHSDWGDRLSPDVLAAIRDKKLLPISDLDRGYVHPSFPAQMIVSYYQGGKICDYIAQRWGESKLLDMARDFAQDRSTPDVIRDQLKMEPEAFDKDFIAEIDKETSKTVAGFPEWTKQIRELSELAKDGKNDDVIAKGRQIEGLYPDYVELGNVYNFIADACIKKGDKACAMDELGRYNKVGGRDSDTVKEYAKLLQEAGKIREAAAALQRLNYIYPLDTDLHEKLGALLLQLKDFPGAVLEYQALVELHPIDVAGSHYNLAMAYKAAGQNDQAREEAINALEAAPDYRPAQKLLLEVSGDGK